MPRFSYKAIDDSGHIQSGELQVSNPEELESRLGRMGLDLIKYRDKTSILDNLHFTGQKVKRQELIVFCFYMEQLMRSGVPLLEGLMDLRDTLEQSYFKDIIASLIEDIEGGRRLSEAMTRFPKVFSTVFINLVQVGEVSGELDTVFKHLADNLKWQDELVAQTKKVLTYPAIVLLVVIFMVVFLMTYLVPQLVDFIENMGHQLPAYTKALIATSDFFVNFWYVLIALPIVLVVSLVLGRHFSYRVLYLSDAYKLRVWLVGPILKKIILARFASFFALMYSSGITVLETLQNTQTFAGNVVIQEALARVQEHISDGASISESFAKANLFPPLVLRMVSIGETTGELDAALLNVSYFYGREVQESIARLQTLIQPALTAILGLVMAWVMFSVLGPLFDIFADLPV